MDAARSRAAELLKRLEAAQAAAPAPVPVLEQTR
jgi:hypothetical protein